MIYNSLGRGGGGGGIIHRSTRASERGERKERAASREFPQVQDQAEREPIAFASASYVQRESGVARLAEIFACPEFLNGPGFAILDPERWGSRLGGFAVGNKCVGWTR